MRVMPEHILSLSYGKDSLACLGAIKHLGLPLDRIVHAEVWATDTIPADLPLMVEFKKHADKIIKQRYGIEVEHICALKAHGRAEASKHTNQCSITSCRAENDAEKSMDFLLITSERGARSSSKLTYEDVFYRVLQKGKTPGRIYGFPMKKGAWCQDRLKGSLIDQYLCSQIVQVERERERETAPPQVVQYLGIAADEPLRIARYISRPGIILPLVEIGWEEDYCGLWCQYNDLLSPIYTDSARGGCWFCHNQSVGQLRLLRRIYPELWALLLKWDIDSPVSFKPDGHTVHDFDRRFQFEDEGFILPDDPKFRWAWLDGDIQMKWF